MLVHGGPGRAGGGEEMGGLRGIRHYMQRVALQGSPDMLTAITNLYAPGARGRKTAVHPFKKYFEELQIGDQLVSEEREITSTDINKFADLTGDHFYALLQIPISPTPCLSDKSRTVTSLSAPQQDSLLMDTPRIPSSSTMESKNCDLPNPIIPATKYT